MRFSPYIYMELAENFYYMNDRNSFSNYVLNYWLVYKDELSNWDEEVFIKIIRVYNYFSYMRSPHNDNYMDLMVFRDLTESVLKWFEAEADNNERLKRALDKVSKDFKKMQDFIEKSEKDPSGPIPWESSTYQPKYFPSRI